MNWVYKSTLKNNINNNVKNLFPRLIFAPMWIVELGVIANGLSGWYWQNTMSRRSEKWNVTRKISKRNAAKWHKRPNEKCMRIHNSQQHQFDYVSFITRRSNRIEMAKTIRRRVLRCVHRCWCPFSTPFSEWEMLASAQQRTQQYSTEDCIYFPFFGSCIHKYFPFDFFYSHFYLHLNLKSMHRTRSAIPCAHNVCHYNVAAYSFRQFTQVDITRSIHE